MKRLLLQMSTWWNGQTIGTRFYTWRKGKRIGEDESGNIYYEGGMFDGRPRRWVIYNGVSEASAIPSGWHGWIHHRTDVPPTEETYDRKEWELDHQPNLTGTAAAYRPKSLRNDQDDSHETKQYEAWTPN